MKPLELALVGCGAIAQAGYLPALARVPEARCLWLVDLRRPLAKRLARRWRIPHVATDLGAVLDRVEAVILAVPNHLHAPMGLLALERGRAVLCEKPLGRTAAEVRGMVAASRKAGAALAAGMIFRQYPGLQAIRGARVQDMLGRVREIRARYGTPLDWPLMSPDFFAREQAGGGALLDLGVHVLDALLWLFSPQGASVLEYEDDGESRVEAEARARLGLLPPERIIKIRKKYKLSQEGLEALFRLGPKVVTRWENDRVLQTRTADDLLRLMERLPEVVRELRAIRQLPTMSPRVAGKRTREL